MSVGEAMMFNQTFCNMRYSCNCTVGAATGHTLGSTRNVVSPTKRLDFRFYLILVN